MKHSTDIMYKKLIRPILDRLDSETWHDIAREALHFAEVSPFTLKLLEIFAYRSKRFKDDRLRVSLAGVELENPLLVGAGWDKAGRAVRGLWQLGFAGVEVGSVLEYPQPGNPKPRQFMLSPGVALNWLSFNTPGMDTVARNLDRYKESGITIGLSIGINSYVDAKDSPRAHAVVADGLYEYADYFVVNVSSPNTPGLRELQEKGLITDIVQAVDQAMIDKGGKKPLFVKIAPELNNKVLDDIIEVVIDHGATGIIAANTADIPELKAKYGDKWRNVKGGLSGDDKDFRKMTTDKVAYIYREAGDKLEIIGVGGIKDTETALEKIKAGASVLQIVTGIRGEGTALPGRINRGIVEYMVREGINSLDEIVGVDVKR
ncbi:quinone-dependent dihydroorotate dehydrogenase [Desulfobacterota bacterium AH_259_B03_O07]|nr:quinone-dependent dihydroorotate dehydrogenase [Desulfobacterota bacterium AH_259_B03_O07]